MTVAELCEELKKFPGDAELVMFDGPSNYSPSRVYVWEDSVTGPGGRLAGKIVID